MEVKLPEDNDTKIENIRAGYIENPKTKDSGIVCAIPQAGECPMKCEECFFQSGRSFLEPLDKNLPNLPLPTKVVNNVVRINDGNDSNVQRERVEEVAKCYNNYFFNTSMNKDLAGFPGPVVLTVNPAKMTDKSFHKVDPIPPNLMYARVRVNTWNLDAVVKPAVEYYTSQGVPVIFTFMAYYTSEPPEGHKRNYEWKKRTLNSYWVLVDYVENAIMWSFKDNPLVYSCGYHGTHECKRCGNCLREYFATKQRMSIYNQ